MDFSKYLLKNLRWRDLFDYQKLSREISYILRHNPLKYNLTLDKEGRADINDLLQKLNARSEWNGLSKKDLEKMIASSDKKRHEIQSDKIRAFYGHSLKEKVQKNPCQPPNVLYHGTVEKFVDSILEKGLITKERQYVHLSTTPETATKVALRRDKKAIILKIDAQKAWDSGIKFYLGNEDIWLSEPIASKFISFLE